MSDNWIIFVPDKPDWVPNDVIIGQLVSLAEAEFPDADEVKAETHDRVMFIDPGSNFETISCPHCQSEIMDWWQNEMEKFEERDELVVQTLPCCGASSSLNDLNYDWPSAFGRFQLDVMNPNVSDAPKAVVEALETIAAVVFRVVRTHI